MKEEFKKAGARKMALAVIGLSLGVVLMLAGGFDGFGGKENADEEQLPSAEIYREQVEPRICDLCSAVRGAGEVRVFVTLSGGYEYVYACDGEGDCVTVGSGSSERAVVEAIRSPQVIGVGVVCTGAENATVKQSLIDLISSSLNIGANRIVVTVGK